MLIVTDNVHRTTHINDNILACTVWQYVVTHIVVTVHIGPLSPNFKCRAGFFKYPQSYLDMRTTYTTFHCQIYWDPCTHCSKIITTPVFMKSRQTGQRLVGNDHLLTWNWLHHPKVTFLTANTVQTLRLG